jgi:VanZ family protein
VTPTRPLALLAVAAAGFIVYGSLVPFRFHDRADALPAFRWCLENRVWPQSRSDGVGNVLVAVPLGFALMGLADRRRGWAGPLWVGCVGLAAAVEFAQLYLPDRTCAASDILAQGVGAAVGMGLWLALGERVSGWGRRVADHPAAGGPAGVVLAGYLLVALGVQLLPLDLDPSPVSLYRKLRDGKAGLLGWPDHSTPGKGLGQVLTLAGLFLPAGLLAARVRNWPPPTVIAAGFGFALLTEAGQLFVSRHASLSDAVVGGGGVAAGWLLGRTASPVGVAAGWAAVLAVVWWLPFDVSAAAGPVNWVPLADLQQADYLSAADVIALRAVLFVPLGLALGRFGWCAAALLACLLEGGQLFLPDRFPTTTDVLLAAVGGWAGGWADRLARGRP